MILQNSLSWIEIEKFDRRSDGGSDLNRDQRLNRFGATQITAELKSKSHLTSDQSWTTLGLNGCFAVKGVESNVLWKSLAAGQCVMMISAWCNVSCITSSGVKSDVGADVEVGIRRHSAATRLKIIFQVLRSIPVRTPTTTMLCSLVIDTWMCTTK